MTHEPKVRIARKRRADSEPRAVRGLAGGRPVVQLYLGADYQARLARWHRRLERDADMTVPLSALVRLALDELMARGDRDVLRKMRDRE